MINRNINNLTDGTRVLIDDLRSGSSLRFARVTVNSENKRDIVTEDGKLYINDGYGSLRSSEKPGDNIFISWSGPFPDLADQDIITYYSTLKSISRNLRNSHDPALLVYVTEISGELTKGKLIQTVHSDTRYGNDFLDRKHQKVGHVIVSEGDVRISTKTLPEGISPGDLVISSDFSCVAEVQEGSSVTYLMALEYSSVLGNAQTVEGLGAIIPDDTSSETVSDPSLLSVQYQSFNVMSIEDVRYQEMVALSRTEPDLGVFISTPDETGRCYLSYVDGTGIQLFGHHYHDIVDVLKVDCPPQGVWALTEPKYWAGPHHSEGGTEWDEELNGTFIPATKDHLDQIGVSVGALGEMIIDSMKDSGHQIGGDAVECGFAWLELAPSYPGQAPTI